MVENKQVIILATTFVVAIVLVAVSVFAFAVGTSAAPANPSTNGSGTSGYYPNGMMGGNWGSMMGGNWGSYATSPTQNASFSLFGYVTLIGAVLSTTVGVAFYFIVPKTTSAALSKTSFSLSGNPASSLPNPYIAISKTLSEEERRVLEVVVAHNGKYLQKYIRSETGLSRLKIHRIVSRLAERGIFTLEKSGNTNEVYLSSWLRSSPIKGTLVREEGKSEIEVQR